MTSERSRVRLLFSYFVAVMSNSRRCGGPRSPDSLLDIAAKVVAENIPFQRIEERYDRIPEPVQRRIIYWSFPRNERDICMYSSLLRVSSSASSGTEHQNLSFYRGLKLVESGCVDNVLQVGFHLSGTVVDSRPNSPTQPAYNAAEPDKKLKKVSLSFDRCKITSVTCSCERKDIFWCPHVVALALYRIRNADAVCLRVPISETLLQMDRQQLQKFVQYLISKHHTEVLPTAQQLADEILQQRSEINKIPGAPDPTAGASADDDHTWHLDEEQVCERVKSFLQGGPSGYYNSNKPLNSLFAKVREMLRARDSNGARMLTLITEQFLSDPRLVSWKSQSQETSMTEKHRQLWDQLGALWVCIVLNPDCSSQEKKHWKELLEKWSRIEVCPLEDPDFRQPPPPPRYHRESNNYNSSDSSSEEEEENCNSYRGNNSSSGYANGTSSSGNCDRPPRRQKSSWPYHSRETRPRTIFHRALDAVNMIWDNSHLKNILMSNTYYSHVPDNMHSSGSFNSFGQPLWHEPLPTCAARIDALRSHGHYQAALRLAVSVVRTMKHNQINAQKKWHESQTSSCSSRCAENHRNSPRYLPYDHRTSPHCPPRCYSPRIRSPGPMRGGPDQACTSRCICNGYDNHHRSSPLCNSRCYCSDSLSRNMSCSPRNLYGDNYSRYSSCSARCSYSENYSRSSAICNSFRGNSSFNDTHRSSPRGSSSSPYYDNHRMSPCNMRTSNSRGFDCRYTAFSKHSTSSTNWTDGWIGHPLDPVGCIFDTLAEASLIMDESVPYPPSYFDSINAEEPGIHIIPRYRHVAALGCRERTETYLTLAVEMALMALGQQRIMPPGMYAQEKAYKQEERLIHRLRGILVDGMESDNSLMAVVRRQAIILLEGGPSSGLGLGIHPESVPMHTFAQFLFAFLLNFFPDLAYEVGLRAMRLPVLEEHEDADHPVNSNVSSITMGRYPRWFMLGPIEGQQCKLATEMLVAAKGEPQRLNMILESAQRHIHSSAHLFKLAGEAFQAAAPETGPRHQKLLEVAFELGLKVMRMTVSTFNWKRREMVRWLVTCAVEVGFQALISIMQNWSSFFTPFEAAVQVASAIMAPGTIMRLNLNYHDQEILSVHARNLALQCTSKDPASCALNALQLCENDQTAYDSAYNIVLHAASNHVMTSNLLFNIARYMESRGFPARAYKLATLAMKTVHLQYNQDTHPAIADIHWACALSHSLGIKELSQMIPIVVKNVQCATVLSDILRRCSITPPGMSFPHPNNDIPKHHHHHHHYHHHSHRSGSLVTRGSVKPLSYDRPPLKQLLDAAVSAYVSTTHSRLMHISPRHYGDFIEFLGKAHETFKLAHDGDAQFAQLVENMKLVYKGKKKLMFLVKERFG